MNRQIKFRAIIDKSHECTPLGLEGWAYGYYMFNDSYGNMPHAIYDTERKEFLPVIAETVGQFTGLTDKEGKDIYEGDILKVGDDNNIVVGWSERFASFVLNKNGWAFSHWFGESCDPKDCEVIGDIHQNTELL